MAFNLKRKLSTSLFRFLFLELGEDVPFEVANYIDIDSLVVFFDLHDAFDECVQRDDCIRWHIECAFGVIKKIGEDFERLFEGDDFRRNGLALKELLIVHLPAH